LLRLSFFLRYDLFFRKCHWLVRRMYIVQMLDEIFCGYLLSPFDLWSHLV
jgi:hypothetical protein